MPRISLWSSELEENDNRDFCRDCVLSGDAMRMCIADFAKFYDADKGDEIDVIDSVDHPDYSGEGYTCENCGRELRSLDN